MQLLNSLVATITLLALTSSMSVEAGGDYAKMDAKLALFKTVANPPASPDAYFNLIGRNGKFCLKTKHHRASGHSTLHATKRCSPALNYPATSNRAYFRVPAADTEANSDFYLAQYIKGKVQCLRMWRHAGAIHRNPIAPWGHRLMFDDCRPDLSYTMRETGSETTPKRLLELTQLGSGKRRRCIRVSPTGGLRIRRCDPKSMSQQIMVVYPRQMMAEKDRPEGERQGNGRSGSYTQITIAAKGYGVSKNGRTYEDSKRSNKSYGGPEEEDHSDSESDNSDSEDEE